MVDEFSPDTMMIAARRIKVAIDLGHVREGDHVVVVGNVVIALDTSRKPETTTTDTSPRMAASSEPKEGKSDVYRKKDMRRSAIDRVTEKVIYNVIRDHQPITSILISDQLGFTRGDAQARGKVSRLLAKLLQTGKAQRVQDDRLRPFRYCISPDMASAEAALIAS